jgi:hypothetical protein
MLSEITAHCDPSFCGDLGCEVSRIITGEHMPNRTAKFVSAVFASLVAVASLTTISHGATPAADDCLAGPKDQTPQGGHWYYHIEHSTNRHCWYLKDEHDKLSQIAPPNASPSATPIAPNTETPMQRSIADARAELPAPQTPVGPDISLATGQPAPAASVNAPGTANSRPAADANTQQSIVASRWLDPSSVSSSAGSGPVTGNSGAAAPSNSATALPPAIAAVPLATADASAAEAEKPSGSIRMILLAIVGALSLAGLMGSAIFRFGGNTRRSGRREIRDDRRAIWDSAGTDPRSPPAFPDAGARVRGTDIPREPRAADDPNRRIAEMLAQLARHTTA